MYFFDLGDYYTKNGFQVSSQTWYNYGASYNQVGCGGGPGFFMDGYFATYRETRNAFLKAVNELYSATMAAKAPSEGINPTQPDSGCTPDFKVAYLDFQFKFADYVSSSIELQYTYKLCRYYYDYGKTLNWQEIPSSEEPFNNEDVDPSLAWGGTYQQYKDYFLNTWSGGNDCRTGTGTQVWGIINPYTNDISGITLTLNYGTSFEIADLTQKVNNYEEKEYIAMCSFKNYLVLTQGPTTDAFDENGNFDKELFKDYNIN